MVIALRGKQNLQDEHADAISQRSIEIAPQRARCQERRILLAVYACLGFTSCMSTHPSGSRSHGWAGQGGYKPESSRPIRMNFADESRVTGDAEENIQASLRQVAL